MVAEQVKAEDQPTNLMLHSTAWLKQNPLQLSVSEIVWMICSMLKKIIIIHAIMYMNSELFLYHIPFTNLV